MPFQLDDRPELTPPRAQDIVVQATPCPKRFQADSQDLLELGVVDPDQARKHKSKIQSALAAIHYQIAQGDIQSGPGVIVGACTDSVLANAH
jgi:hypothetical protein